MNFKKILLFFVFFVCSCKMLENKNDKYFELPPYLRVENTVGTIKKIKINEYPNAFNPGIIQDGADYILMYRVQEKSNFLGLSILDNQFNVKKTQKILCPIDSKELSGNRNCEDPRLFRFKEKIYVVYNDINELTDGRSIFLSELSKENDQYFLDDAMVLNFNDSKVEKNWTPFEYLGDLYFIYSIYPDYIILKMESFQKPIKLKEVSNKFFDKKPWDFIESSPLTMRGGTPAIKDPNFSDSYSTIFHSYSIYRSNGIEKYVYYFGLYSFSPDSNFKSKYISFYPIVINKLYKTYDEKVVVYPQGLIIDNENNYIISAGLNDKEIIMIKIEPIEIINNIKQIETITIE